MFVKDMVDVPVHIPVETVVVGDDLILKLADWVADEKEMLQLRQIGQVTYTPTTQNFRTEPVLPGPVKGVRSEGEKNSTKKDKFSQYFGFFLA